MIELNNVSVNLQKTQILKNINITINTHEVIGIVGESGSGKTTLAHLLLGLIRPKSGELKTHGVQRLPIFQHANDSFNPKYNMKTSLHEPIKYYKNADAEKVKERLKWLMFKMQLDDSLLTRFPEELSGGQLQRFNMIRTLMVEPDILICDEITTNVDVLAEQRIITILKEYHERTNNGMVIISHDLAFLNQIVDRMIVMADGEIKDDFEIEALFASQRHPETKKLLSVY